MSFSRTLGSLLGIGGGTRGIASPDDEAQTQPVKQGPYLPVSDLGGRLAVQDPWGRSPANPEYGQPPADGRPRLDADFPKRPIVGPGGPSVPFGASAPPGGPRPVMQAAEEFRPYMQDPRPVMQAAPPQQNASAYQAPQPTTRISTARPPQTLGGLLGIGYGYGPSRPSPLASQLPMGRASATGSIPFQQDGRNTWTAWGGLVR